MHQQRARIARADPTARRMRYTSPYYRTITAVKAATFLQKRLQNAARGSGGEKRHFGAFKKLPYESVCSKEGFFFYFYLFIYLF